MQEQQQQRPLTLSQKAELVPALAIFPAMTIIVFLRRKVGYRFLDPLKYMVMVLLIWALAGFASASGNIRSAAGLALFSIVVLILAILQRRFRWGDILNGISWHTYSRGISWLHYVFPRWEVDFLYRFVDPLAAAIVGLLLSFLFPWLGYYLIFAAVCLFIFQSADYQRSINLALNALDGLIESKVQGENVAFFSEDGKAEARPIEETAGIPTGVSPDLNAAIARLQSKPSQLPRWQQQSTP